MRIRPHIWFLGAVLLFVNLYSLSTLTTKPAYWYDEAMNVELAHTFADFGKLDLITAPNVPSGRGSTIGSTGYPVTVPLAGFFKLFGFGLAQARVYMLLWMSAFIIAFFYITRRLWGDKVAYFGTLLIATFAPFYGNGRSVMGEIPGFFFFLLSFYFFEQKKWWRSGLLLGLALISKPSIFVFLIPAYAIMLLCQSGAWKQKLMSLIKVGVSAALALVPWLLIYAGEISHGGIGAAILNHFKNPYEQAGASVLMNIQHNLPTLLTSSTLLYMWVLLVGVLVTLFLERKLFREHKNLLILSAVYLPLVLFQYLKSFGYLRYLIAGEFLVFILFVITLPTILRIVHTKFGISASQIPRAIAAVVVCLSVFQTVHLFFFADLYSSEKTQKTILYLYSNYPAAQTVGVINVPQIASFIPPFQKYQYLSTYGLPEFGTHMLYLSPEKLPNVIITESGTEGLSQEEQALLTLLYERDAAFTEGFLVYTKKY